MLSTPSSVLTLFDLSNGKEDHPCRVDSAMGRARYERKKAKYEELVQECREAGWGAWNYLVEVGCRDFPALLLGKMFQDVGIVGQTRKNAGH